jgi:putative flippase GtrA
VKLPESQFLRFCVVGTVGFVVDAGLLYALMRGAGADPYSGRVASFLVAASVTWALNRSFTFRSETAGARDRMHRQWRDYVALMAVGAAINYGVYVLCLLNSPVMRAIPTLAVAVGAVVALAFNYLASKNLIFARRG